MQTVFLFSGQGSQYLEMGRQLFQEHPTFRARFHELDHVARRWLGTSVAEYVYGTAAKATRELDNLTLSSVAIFIVECAVVRMLKLEGFAADLHLSVSMGGFAAAVTAGCLDAERAIQMLVRQAELIERYCPLGGMLAVLEPQTACAGALFSIDVDIAGSYFDRHFVVAAGRDLLAEAESRLAAGNLTFARVPVRYGFHSRWVDPVEDAWRLELGSVTYVQARTPVLCCGDLTPRNDLPQDFFWTAARARIRFHEAIALVEQAGPTLYVDVGPSGSLASCTRYLLPTTSRSKAVPIVTQFGRDVENLERLRRVFEPLS